jgi:hypothetical protein
MFSSVDIDSISVYLVQRRKRKLCVVDGLTPIVSIVPSELYTDFFNGLTEQAAEKFRTGRRDLPQRL